MCFRMSRNAWMLVSAVFEQNCRTTSPWQKLRVERVVGKLLHRDQACRPQFCKSVAVVEQRCADRDGHGQVVRKDIRPEQTELSGGGYSGPRSGFAAFHQKGDALGQGPKQPFKAARSSARTSKLAISAAAGWASITPD